MKELPQVTMVIVDCVNPGEAIFAIEKSLEKIKPAHTIWFTSLDYESNDKFEVVKIDPIRSKQEYSYWMLEKLGTYVPQLIETTHILVIQGDGYVLDDSVWTDEFLKYSFIGSPWLYVDGHNVGNGGFSLRSSELCFEISKEIFDGYFIKSHPEDDFIGRMMRDRLEAGGFTFAPEELAHKFAYELHTPKQPTFGFHGNFHPPYKKYIVIRRVGALGDVIQTEPILEHYHNLGYNVVIDCHPNFYYLWMSHRFKVILYADFDHSQIQHEVINLDMAYEVKPRQLHMKSYFEACGIKDYKLRNPILNYDIGENRLFKRYVVLHIDQRDTMHRNVYGVNWFDVVLHIQNLGYDVIQIGMGPHEPVALEMNTSNPSLLFWLIAGCEFMIGIDSGPSHIATALGKKAVLFFGSVDPDVIHYNQSNMIILKSDCPIGTPNCWSSTIGTRGIDCRVPDAVVPPCTVIDTNRVLNAVDTIIDL